MAEPSLLRAFRFQVKLRKSAALTGATSPSAFASVSAGASAGFGGSAQASASISASVGASASVSGGASFGGGASASAAIGVNGALSGSAALSSGLASVGGSLSGGLGAGVSIGPAGGDALGDGAFQECSGLDIEMDVSDYLEGGVNDRVHRRVGRAKYQTIVLKRGMFYANGKVNRELWAWLQSIVEGRRPVPRYDGMIQVMGVASDVVATWTFERGLPSKVSGPSLNAKTGEIAIEELHIAHEKLALGDP